MRLLMQSTMAIALALLSFHHLNAAQRAQSASPKIASGAATSEGGAQTKESTIGANQPVITLQGLCIDDPKKEGDGADCNKTVTREEFENLLNALNPGGQQVPPIARRNLAQAYLELVAFEIAARKAGLEDTAQFHELVNWLRLRTVADLYRRSLQEQYRTPSPDEIDAYYNQHLASFERVRLARIFIPRENLPPVDKNEFEKKAAEAARTAYERAAGGEDPFQIQKDVYLILGVKAPPATDLGDFRRAELQEKEREEVFSLKPGQVSQVEIEPKSYVVYKVLGKDTLTEDQVKAEITRDISQQKFKDALKSAIDSVHAQFNERYFGPGVMATLPTEAPIIPIRPPGH